MLTKQLAAAAAVTIAIAASSGMFADWNPRVSCAQYTGE
jgi:hypothetical protein